MPRSYSPLADVMAQVIPSDAKDRIYGIGLVQRRWRNAVGVELARRSEPDSLNDGVLTVRVTDPAWGRMLMKLGQRIVPRLNHALGVRLVRRINFKTVSRLEQAPMASLPSDSGPRSSGAVLPESVAKVVDSIQDSEIREIVGRTAARYFAARKNAERRRT
ncbi:MAG TPA: DUF721 domain-containing protein [Vicinamibacteria bacterium]|nr:DUF721 domain-containing protein [Vicinamibacteria bacterium]